MIWHKLRDLGIVDEFGKWLHDFFKGTKSQVIVANNAFSDEISVVSGVAQGRQLFLVTLSDMLLASYLHQLS